VEHPHLGILVHEHQSNGSEYHGVHGDTIGVEADGPSVIADGECGRLDEVADAHAFLQVVPNDLKFVCSHLRLSGAC